MTISMGGSLAWIAFKMSLHVVIFYGSVCFERPYLFAAPVFAS